MFLLRIEYSVKKKTREKDYKKKKPFSKMPKGWNLQAPQTERF